MTTIRQTLLGALVLVGLCMANNPASAAPLYYDEAVSGEVDLTYSNTPFLLDLGVNQILGTTGCLPGDCPDFDQFAFDIPAGLQLTQVNLLFRLVEDAAIDSQLTTSFEIDDDQDGFGPGLAFQGFDFSLVSSPLNNLFTTVLPLGPGGYEMLGGSISASESWGLYYEWNLVVEEADSIPEPGAIALLGIGASVVRRCRAGRHAGRRRRE